MNEERFDFVELAETVAGRLLIDAPGTNYVFHYEIPEDKVFVLADKRRMEQVLGNLIENAKKYVLPGGEIRLKIQRENDRIQFSIFNQSPPIDEQELSKFGASFIEARISETKAPAWDLPSFLRSFPCIRPRMAYITSKMVLSSIFSFQR